MVITMNNVLLLSAQIKYFNEQVKKDLSDEQIAEVADYSFRTNSDTLEHLKALLDEIKKIDFSNIADKPYCHLGICNVLNSITWLDAYTIIAKLSYRFYSSFEYLQPLHSQWYYDDTGLAYPIPSKTHFDNVKNQWVGVQLTRRLAYIDWLTRQFKLMINHLES